MPALQTTHMAEGSSGGYAQNHVTSYLGRKGGGQTVLSFNIDEEIKILRIHKARKRWGRTMECQGVFQSQQTAMRSGALKGIVLSMA